MDCRLMADSEQLHVILTTYLHKLQALHETLPSLLVMTYVSADIAQTKRNDFIKEVGEEVTTENGKKNYTINQEHRHTQDQLEKKMNRSITALSVLPSKFLVSFVSEYDAFLGSLVKGILDCKPELLDLSDRTIKFSDLKDMGSIEAAHNHFLEKEVETLLRKSHSEQFESLKSKFSIELKKGLDSWPTFIELTERRNLLVHCDGVVSTQYLKVCKEHGVSIPDDVIIGTKLTTSKAYLEDAYLCLYEIGVKLTQVLWRKQFACDLEHADGSLISVTYDLIHEEEYALASCLLDFSVCTLKKWGSDSKRKTLIINRAQSYYHAGATDKCRAILDAEDWSSCGDEYQICVDVLKDSYEDATERMKRIGASGKLEETDYLVWPVFKDFRLLDEFKSTFKDVFGKEPTDGTLSFTSEQHLADVVDYLAEARMLKKELLSADK